VARAPKATEVSLDVQTGPVAIAALDEAIAELASKLASLPTHHRGHAASMVENIERLAAVRAAIERSSHG
jgi:hypothetical protein